MSQRRGKVVIVGAGPGDPELITVKGLKALREADVVIYDRLIPKDLLSEVKPGCKLIFAGKSPGRHELEQEEINRLLVQNASAGLNVVRLKGGDPYTFGRGEEECEYVIAHGIPCEVIPGVPSYVGAAAYAGMPLAGRVYGSSFAVVTGHVAGGKKEFEDYLSRLSGLARHVDNIVILMGASTARVVLEVIASVRGRDAPAAVVMNATTGSQVTIAGTIDELLSEAERGTIRSPAVIIVGPAALARGKLWRADAGSST
ncbi:MAG: uroporphyrinogen-III C-methyltransferase [Acidilobus sp.]